MVDYPLLHQSTLAACPTNRDHLIWRKILPDESERADNSITDLGYELITRGRYKLAISILEFAKSLRDVVELKKRTNVVNLANAYKLSGDPKKAEATCLSWIGALCLYSSQFALRQ
jgi:hypothetical protein